MNLNSQQEKSTKDSDLTKDELEKEKLRLEITELGRPWWRKPAHLYTLLAICSLSVAFLTGQFQANSIRLDTEKAILAYKNEEFALKRDAVHKELEQAVRDRENYRDQIKGATQQLVSANQELTSAKQELATVKQQLEIDKMQQTLRSTEHSLSTLALSNTRINTSLGIQATMPPIKIVPPINTSSGLQPPARRKFNYELLTVQPSLLANHRNPPVKKTWYQSAKQRIASFIP